MAEQLLSVHQALGRTSPAKLVLTLPILNTWSDRRGGSPRKPVPARGEGGSPCRSRMTLSPMVILFTSAACKEADTM